MSRTDIYIATGRNKLSTSTETTYIAHMYSMFVGMGYHPIICKITKLGEYKPRKFTGWPISYVNVSVSYLRERCEEGAQVFIVGVDTTNQRAKTLWDYVLRWHHNSHLVALTEEDIDMWPRCGFRVARARGAFICTTRGIKDQVDRHGGHGAYIPVPYGPPQSLTKRKNTVALCLSRIRGGKNIPMVLRANSVLKTVDVPAIPILGRTDITYMRDYLAPEHPETRLWSKQASSRKAHRGLHSAFKLCESALLSVNLTQHRTQGGHAEYLSLEAWAAGCVPVVHLSSLNHPHENDMNMHSNCFAVDTHTRLAALVQDYDEWFQKDRDKTILELAPLLKGGKKVLNKHSFPVLAPQFMKLMGDKGRAKLTRHDLTAKKDKQ